MKGESTPVWDHGSRGSSPFWLGEGRVPSGNVAAPELVVLVLRNLDSCEQEGGVRLGKQHRVPLHPPRTFLKLFTVVETSSDCCNIGSRANQLTGSRSPSPIWSEKVQQHLPLGGDLREGTRSDFRTRGLKMNQPFIFVHIYIYIQCIALSGKKGRFANMTQDATLVLCCTNSFVGDGAVSL